MITGVITKDNKESPEFKISGYAAILIWGDGEIGILRSVGESPFLPMTDNSGSSIVLTSFDESGVILNTDIHNSRQGCKFKIVGDTESEIHYVINSEF